MHLNSDQLEKLKGQLEERQEKLRGSMSSLERTNPASDPERLNENSDIGDEATEDAELVRHESLQSETGIMLKRVEEALSRIEDGTYGTTLEGEEIPYERLLADPTATTLVR